MTLGILPFHAARASESQDTADVHVNSRTFTAGRFSGGSSYEAAEAGRHLSFWENAFFLRKRNQICVSLYVSLNTR